MNLYLPEQSSVKYISNSKYISNNKLIAICRGTERSRIE